MSQANQHLNDLPIIAILRGISPAEIMDVAEILVDNGLKIIEVPLNSPTPLASIELLSQQLGNSCLCGAGTVTTVEQVEQIKAADGQLIVSPNTNPAVIKRTLELDMISIPGFQTATEAYTAIEAGAKWLKFFPAASNGTSHLKDILSVIPSDIKIIATGAINPNNLTQWLAIGAWGAGIGSNIYHPTIDYQDIRQCASQLVATYHQFKRDH